MKDEEQKVVPIIPEKSATRSDMEKAYHKDMPKQIKAILQEYKDIFPMDLPPLLPPVQMGQRVQD